jgi:hypothetical protein
MAKSKQISQVEISQVEDVATLTTTGPLVFIRHDARDKNAMERVRAGASSPQRGTEGRWP